MLSWMRAPRWAIFGLALSSSIFAGCQSDGAAAPAAAPPPTEVGIATIERRDVTLMKELPGRTSAYEVSEVRPQVTGIVQARLFEEGQLVREGQTLYQIDPRVYRAAAAQARANLESAKASHELARVRAERYELLAKERVISELELADARAAAAQAAAAIEQAEAALTTANVKLRFTEVPAPISGRIGRSLVTTGALVTQGQTAPLTTIQRLDPIFVDLQQSSDELLALRRSLASGGALPASTDVRLELGDGTDYPHFGTLQFAEATVDPSTGTVTLRARFENPEGLLLPGMYVRALVGQAERKGAILAPQQGVTRDPRGNATALVVEEGDKVALRELEVSRVLGTQWLVERGLEEGDRIVVEGTDKVRPGQVVKPVPIALPATAAPRGAGAGEP